MRPDFLTMSARSIPAHDLGCILLSIFPVLRALFELDIRPSATRRASGSGIDGHVVSVY